MLYVLHTCDACYTQCDITHVKHASLAELHVPCKLPSTTHSLCHLTYYLFLFPQNCSYACTGWDPGPPECMGVLQ